MKNPLTTFSRRPNLLSHGPWRAMEELESEMQRWFGENSREAFSPATDFQENEKEYSLKVDLPGVKKEDVKIEVDGNTLTVHGERKEEKEEKSGKSYYSEAYYGSFTRNFMLPQSVDESRVKAQYKDGVLKITVPKSESTQVKTVTIQ